MSKYLKLAYYIQCITVFKQYVECIIVYQYILTLGYLHCVKSIVWCVCKAYKE